MKRFICSLFAIMMLILMWGTIEPTYAGGPFVAGVNGQPVRWARREIRGGMFGGRIPESTTVDAQGRVVYRVDQGNLGPLTNAEAMALVDRIFKLYTDIPTASIEFVNGGPILDPNTKQPVDITGRNVGLVVSNNATFQNPVIFDSDGSILGGGGVLGVVIPFAQTQDNGINTPELLESVIVLNGAEIDDIGGKIPFLGVFTHEFAHFAGPLDHSQINGFFIEAIFTGNFEDANLPRGFTSAQVFDIFAPFLETVYPFVLPSPSSSKLNANGGFRGSGATGAFIASLCFDDQVSLSTLYPMPGYLPTESGSQFGGISGKVVIPTPDGGELFNGVNIVVRRISRGSFPPKPDLEVYKDGKPPLDSDGVPIPPEDRDEFDALATATNAVTGVNNGLGVGSGEYRIVGLPPGQYMVSVERINPDLVGGSGVGPNFNQAGLFVADRYNGANETGDTATDNPEQFTPVTVTAGSFTTGIDIILNNIGGSAVKNVAEKEPNEKVKKAQVLDVDTRISGAVASTDKSKLQIDFGRSGIDPLEDVYKITLSQASSLVISLEGENRATDIELYLFNSSVPAKGRVSIQDPSIINVSFGDFGSELITERLNPGTYFIGVTSLGGSSKYKLSVFRQR